MSNPNVRIAPVFTDTRMFHDSVSFNISLSPEGSFQTSPLYYKEDAEPNSIAGRTFSPPANTYMTFSAEPIYEYGQRWGRNRAAMRLLRLVRVAIHDNAKAHAFFVSSECLMNQVRFLVGHAAAQPGIGEIYNNTEALAITSGSHAVTRGVRGDIMTTSWVPFGWHLPYQNEADKFAPVATDIHSNAFWRVLFMAHVGTEGSSPLFSMPLPPHRLIEMSQLLIVLATQVAKREAMFDALYGDSYRKKESDR